MYPSQLYHMPSESQVLIVHLVASSLSTNAQPHLVTELSLNSRSSLLISLPGFSFGDMQYVSSDSSSVKNLDTSSSILSIGKSHKPKPSSIFPVTTVWDIDITNISSLFKDTKQTISI